MIDKLKWSDSIFFFDIDDTLIETAENSLIAADNIFNSLKKDISKGKASLIVDRFKFIFNTLANQHWDNHENNEYDLLINKITELQQPVINKYGNIRKWSREVFLKIAADDNEVNLKPEIVYESIDSYWNRVSELSTPISGVLSLFDEVKEHKRPIYLITGSDARLKINDNGLFYYDPIYSESFKAKRIEKLRDKGLTFDKVSIGDPQDKPSVEFFEKGLKIAQDDIGTKINTKNIIMFGDSYEADLKTPKEKLGFGLVVLYRKGQKDLKEESDGYISTGNINLVTNYLK